MRQTLMLVGINQSLGRRTRNEQPGDVAGLMRTLNFAARISDRWVPQRTSEFRKSFRRRRET
jgi:predicted trehalose synthase